MQGYQEETKAMTNDRVFEVAMHRGSSCDLYYVVAWSSVDAVGSLVRMFNSLPQPEGWSIKEYYFTAESS